MDLGNGKAVKLAAGCAFALATHALAELPIMQFTPSLTAAAVLVAARKAQVIFSTWNIKVSRPFHYFVLAFSACTQLSPCTRPKA